MTRIYFTPEDILRLTGTKQAKDADFHIDRDNWVSYANTPTALSNTAYTKLAEEARRLARIKGPLTYKVTQ